MKPRRYRLLPLSLLLASVSVMAADSHSDAARTRLMNDIAHDFIATARMTGVREMSPAVAAAMASVPRHRFVPAGGQAAAYANRPLTIGHGQTISQPFIVALMTELAAVSPGDRVLEIGTGSGYQAAVLAALGAHVYTIEIIEPLGRRAAGLLAELGYDTVEVRIGDGNAGWPEAAMAGALNLRLGGPRLYGDRAVDGAWFGDGSPGADAADVRRALKLVRRVWFGSIAIACLIAVFPYLGDLP